MRLRWRRKPSAASPASITGAPAGAETAFEESVTVFSALAVAPLGVPRLIAVKFVKRVGSGGLIGRESSVTGMVLVLKLS